MHASNEGGYLLSWSAVLQIRTLARSAETQGRACSRGRHNQFRIDRCVSALALTAKQPLQGGRNGAIPSDKYANDTNERAGDALTSEPLVTTILV